MFNTLNKFGGDSGGVCEDWEAGGIFCVSVCLRRLLRRLIADFILLIFIFCDKDRECCGGRSG